MKVQNKKKTQTWLLILGVYCAPLAHATVPSVFTQQSADWMRSEEGIRIADNVLSWQSPHGSWPKNGDTATKPYDGARKDLRGTFDNGATTGELRFLARAFNASDELRFRDGFLKGLNHILEAQYPTGGWPQYFPPGNGYPRHITFNDNSMIRILEFLQEVCGGTAYDFVGQEKRASIQVAIEKGIQCILDCQIKVNGKLTVWCAQHDAVTFEPRPARSYELESLSGGESAGILRFLMKLDHPSSAVKRAIRSGAEWYAASKVHGIRLEKKPDVGRVTVQDPDAEVLWARFYEIETNRPFFCDRDGIKKYDYNEIGMERRNGYSWYGSYGKDIAETFQSWEQKW
jgi:PelA/Pel-15E family pectate lyase